MMLHGFCRGVLEGRVAGLWQWRYYPSNVSSGGRCVSTTHSHTHSHFYEPRKGHGLQHDPFNSIIAPRPIGWIGTTSTCDSSGGQHNLAPYSFFNAFNYNPPIIGFSSIGRKHTLRNIQATSCFTWNLANITLADKMNKTSDDVACDVSEFEHAGLTPVSSLLIAAPRVAESPVSFECKVTQIVQLSDTREDLLETWLVLGEVVGVHIDQKMIRGGIYDTVSSEVIMRGGGAGDYYSLSWENKFQMRRAAPSKGK